MASIEDDDVVTYYFVVQETRKLGFDKMIKAWTPNKDYVQAYMDFHKCKDFTVKKVTKTWSEMVKILNECAQDEIRLTNITIKSTSKSKDVEYVTIPATETEIQFIQAESSSFMSMMVDYSYLNEMIPFLKEKYQKALRVLLLPEIIRVVIHRMPSKIVSQLEVDQLAVLVKGFPDAFGM